MLAVIVGTHGNFAIELIRTCEMICGTLSNVKAVTLLPGEGAEDLARKYETALSELDIEDKYGVVTGVNLSMLIEMFGYQQAYSEVDIIGAMEKAVDAGKNGMQCFHMSTIQNEEDDL